MQTKTRMEIVKMSNSFANKAPCLYLPCPEGFFVEEEDLRELFLVPLEVSFELDLVDPSELFLFFFFDSGEVGEGPGGRLS